MSEKTSFSHKQVVIRSPLRKKLHLAWENRALYVMILPLLLYLIIFHYWPLYGVQIAWRNYTFADGIIGSKWVGMKWFNLFFKSPQFKNVLSNTIILNLYCFAAGFPAPILLALVLHNVPSKRFVRITQTITYLPHFISVVVIVGMLSCFLSLNSGFINHMIEALGGTPRFFMGEAKYFRHVYVWSDVWQGIGWGSIIYLASLTGISPELHEAATIDGASKLQRIIHIELTGLAPTIVIMLIMRCGSIVSMGFDKVFLMQNSVNASVSEVISTYTYKMGLINTKYSYSAAIGLFNNIINFILLTIVNTIAKRLSGTSLW